MIDCVESLLFELSVREPHIRLTLISHFTVMASLSILGLGSAVAQEFDDISGTPPGVAPGEKYHRQLVRRLRIHRHPLRLTHFARSQVCQCDEQWTEFMQLFLKQKARKK